MKNINQKQKRIILGLLFGVTFFIGGYYIVKAATYYWTQSSWTGADPTDQFACETAGGTWDATNSKCTAVHITNATNWTLYSEKDENATIGENVSISLQVEAVTEDETTEFSDGASVGVTTDSDIVSLDLPS